MIKAINSSEIFDAVEVPELWPWEFITVHHTASGVINRDRHYGKMIDELHRTGKNWKNGMGYHFLINPDGVIEVGDRWINQLEGAHNLGWNKRSIGVAFVGNFSDIGKFPGPKQIVSYNSIRERFSDLLAYPHCAFKATECPGKNIDLRNWFRIFENEIFK